MRYLSLALILFSLPVLANPKQGADYTYQTILHSRDIIRHPDEALIPPDSKNEDYQAFRAWDKTHKPTTYQPKKEK